MRSPPSLALAIRAKSTTSATFDRDHAATRPALALGSDFDSIGTASKIRRVSNSSCRKPALPRLLDTGAQVNILQAVRAALPAVVAGFRAYTDFRALLQMGQFPPLASAVIRWSAAFAPGRTWIIYISQSSKACALGAMDTLWRTE